MTKAPREIARRDTRRQVPITEAAAELGLTIAATLAMAEEYAPRRLDLWMLVPRDAAVWPGPPDVPTLALTPADRMFACICATNEPGLFLRLATSASITLADGDHLMLVDGSGSVDASGLEVTLADLWVPRADLDALAGGSSGKEPEGARQTETLKRMLGLLAQLLGKEGYGTEDEPNVSEIVVAALSLDTAKVDGAIIRGLGKDNFGAMVNEGLRLNSGMARVRGRKPSID